MEIELRREDKSKGRDFEKFTSLLQIIFQYISIGHNNGLILYYFSKLGFSKPVFLNRWAVGSFQWASNLVVLLSLTAKL